MIIVHVHILVKKDCLDNFKEATIENAKNSINEPGVLKFDFIEQEDDPYKFIRIEIYKDIDAALAHKETQHYKKWKITVEPMMEQARKSLKYISIFQS